MLVLPPFDLAPQIPFLSSRSKVAAAKSDFATFEPVLDRFYVDTERYPTCPEGLEVLGGKPSLKGWRGLSVTKFTFDPWGHTDVYTAKPKGKGSPPPATAPTVAMADRVSLPTWKSAADAGCRSRHNCGDFFARTNRHRAPYYRSKLYRLRIEAES